MKDYKSPTAKHQSLITSHRSLFIVVCFLVWRIGLLIIAGIAPLFIPVFADRFPYRAEFLLKPYYEFWFWVWGNFDGVHYLRIAQEGYSAEFSQVFFPLYPALVGFLGRLFVGEYIIAGFLISNFSFLAALALLFKLLIIDFKAGDVKKAIIFLLIFPTSFFFGAIYTEGLFLLLVVASFYFARKGNFLAASIAGFFASLTRFIGVFLFPALLTEYYLQNKSSLSLQDRPITNHRSLITKAAPLLLIPAGLAIYMIYLAWAFGDPVYFLTAQPVFGAERTAGEIILLPQVIWRYLKIFATVPIESLSFFNAAFEFAAAGLFLLLAVVAFKKVRVSYALFSLLALITPTLTGTFSSMPRYVLVAFPAFLILAQIRNLFIKLLLLLLFFLLLIFSVMLFSRGYWVA